MTHKSILENFSFRFLVRALEEELGAILFRAKCYRHLKTPEEELNYILEQLLPRWNIMFDSKDFSEVYKYNTYITMATYLNNYGYQNDGITKKAVAGLTKLKNDEFGLLPAHQYKKAEKAIALLEAPVAYHTKKPGYKATVTQFRQGDVLSIKCKGFYYAAIINEVTDVYESVSVCTYEKIFEDEPTLSDLQNIPFLKDIHSISNLNYIQDPAGQFKLIENIKWEPIKYSLIASKIDEYLNDLKMCRLTIKNK